MSEHTHKATPPDHDPMDRTMNEKHEQPDDTTVLGDPTRAIPEPPFRVEPAQPVPDDVVVPEPVAPAGPPAPDPATRQPEPTPYRPPLVTIQKGPRPGTVVLGLLTLVVAAYVLVTNLTGAQVDLTRTGPVLVGGLGVLLVLVGVTGVLLGRRR
ncbi:hypothetical protein [Intrasporangium sp.]|uniref:hypothetical protein n=1 Tax=Intrasporangium sp. TaxID=1925024 RepID=UPI00322169C7